MVRLWIAWVSALCPLLGMACESTDRHKCQEQIVALVSYRTEAIESAFGDLSGALPEQLQVKFVKAKDPEYALLAGGVAYDRERRILLFPRTVLGAKIPNPLRWAIYYWPFYQVEQYRQAFPVVEAVDNVLWSAYLQESAKIRGLTWPHQDCSSVDVSKRLPCEMVMAGIAEYVKARRNPIFNENRLDRIWPEDFSDFRQRVWRYNDPEYLDVQRYGGILLLRPLINEFGVPRALAYIAQTPFHIEENNLRISALRYQDRARDALRLRTADAEPFAPGESRHAQRQATPAYVPEVRGVIATAAPQAAGRPD